MKIVVFNGSPKTEFSVTMQYIQYLKKLYPQHEVTTFNITRDIEKIKKDVTLFDSIVNAAAQSDLLIWAYPVFGLLVPAESKRFIELLFESGKAAELADKYTAVIATSVRFLDNYSRYYIQAICEDLGMKYLGEFFAYAEDLLREEERRQFEIFLQDILTRTETNSLTFSEYAPVVPHKFKFIPPQGSYARIRTGLKTVILANFESNSDNLREMVTAFQNCLEGPTEVIDLHGLTKRGCIECYRCTENNVCVFGKSDGFAAVYEKIRNEADIVVFADTIHDRYISSDYKYFVDRCFVVNHQPRLPGKKVGYILSGPLNQMITLRHCFEAWVETNEGSLAGIVSDDSESSSLLQSQLHILAERLVAFGETGYRKPMMFEGTAAKKIYRDEIWGNLRKVFVSDHKYYKKHGFYDFPQRNLAQRAGNFFMGLLNKLPFFRKWLMKNVQRIKIKDYKKMFQQGT